MKSNFSLGRQAVRLFPQTDYADPSAVRHARRKWIEAVKFLRDRPNGSRWHVDRMVGRKVQLDA